MVAGRDGQEACSCPDCTFSKPVSGKYSPPFGKLWPGCTITHTCLIINSLNGESWLTYDHINVDMQQQLVWKINGEPNHF